jgi:hypothetical protein
VFIDGELVASRIDGRALDIDPGEHHVRFQSAGRAPSEQTVVVLEGQKGRTIVTTLHAAAATSSAVHVVATRPVPASVLVAGSVGVASVAAFGVFGGLYLAGRGDLDACKPGCSASAIDDVAWKGVVSDVALVVGAAALVTTLVLYLVRPTHTVTVGLAF